MWTRFFDMSSGGSEKLGACTIWIEAEESAATDWFKRIFDRDPSNITCACCGEDYSFYECDFDPKPRDWVVSVADIERVKGGHLLTHEVIVVT